MEGGEQLSAHRNYQVALDLAKTKLRKCDPAEAARASGSEIINQTIGEIRLKVMFLGWPVEVGWPQGEIVYAGNIAEEVSVWHQILILHYLTNAKPVSLSGNLVTFRQLEGGEVYYPTFQKRANLRLLQGFGEFPERLPVVGEEIGGRPAEIGDASIRVPAFPKVPITLAVWRGDEEFPPECNIVFDATISTFLSTEDVVVLCQETVSRLLKLAKVRWPG